MLRRRAADSAGRVAAASIALASFAVSGTVIALGPPDRVGALSVILGIAAVGAGLLVAGERDGLSISASFIVTVLAAAFLGDASAAATAVLAKIEFTLKD